LFKEMYNRKNNDCPIIRRHTVGEDRRVYVSGVEKSLYQEESFVSNTFNGNIKSKSENLRRESVKVGVRLVDGHFTPRWIRGF
jgi:hypothetical protein